MERLESVTCVLKKWVFSFCFLLWSYFGNFFLGNFSLFFFFFFAPSNNLFGNFPIDSFLKKLGYYATILWLSNAITQSPRSMMGLCCEARQLSLNVCGKMSWTCKWLIVVGKKSWPRPGKRYNIIAIVFYREKLHFNSCSWGLISLLCLVAQEISTKTDSFLESAGKGCET